MPTYSAKEKAAYAAKMKRARAKPTRATNRVSGRGFYKGFSRDVGTALGAAVGGFTGGLPGAMAGAKFGNIAGSGFSRITGLGAYSMPAVRKNSLVLPMNPRIKNDLEREGAVVISHREHIGTVKSSTGFTVQYELPLNPAQNSTFPWLSAVASEFSQWEPLGIIFEYVSTSGSAVSSTNNALGEVIMTVNSNSLDTAYVSKTQMLNSDFAQAFAPSQNGALPVECSPQQSTLTKLYTRYGAAKTTADIRMSDLGVLSIATSGMQAADIEVGELYVNYQIALLKPQLVQELGFLLPQAYYAMGTVTDSTPLGATQTKQMDTIGCTFTSTAVTLPRNTSGKFKILLIWGGTTAAAVIPSVTLTNATGVDAFAGNTADYINNGSTTTNRLILQHGFLVTDSSKEVTVTYGTGGTLPTSLIYADIYVEQMNWDIDQ